MQKGFFKEKRLIWWHSKENDLSWSSMGQGLAGNIGMIPDLRPGVVVEVMHTPAILALRGVEANGLEVQDHAQLRSKVSEQSGSGRHKTLSLNKGCGGRWGEDLSVLRGGGLLQLRIRAERNKRKNGQTYLGLSSLLSSLSPGLLRLWQA